MKIIKNILAIAFLAIVFQSCSNDFFDINEDPNGPTSTTPDKMMPSVIDGTMNMMGLTSFVTTTITQHRSFTWGVPNDWSTFAWTNYSFQNNYWRVGSNNELMMQFAEEEGSLHYRGAGKLIKAFAFSVTVDFFGDVYYTDAFKGVSQPKFDDGEFVYRELLNLCDEGISDLQSNNNFRPLSEGDIMYNGDLNKWIRFGYSLKARLLNHLTKKSYYDPSEVLSLVDQGFTSTTDDAGFVYSGAWEQSNPWGPTGSSDGYGGYSTFWHKTVVDYLKGDNLGGVEDPRINFIVNTAAADGEYRGVKDGNTLDGMNADMVSPTFGKYYTTDTTPYPLMTFEEVKFIEAEAAFLADNKNRALSALESGVIANMLKVGVSQVDIDAYLANPTVFPQTTASLTLSHIMMQKYLSLGFNPEIWVDMRRHDYSTNIYPALQQPDNPNAAFGGEWIRRMEVFSTEIQYNPAEVERIGGNDSDYMIKKVWWDIEE
ncbi:SusD/RagB family nutrient-binding outer membrane lipoprotein [Wocania ichthyoenteri]|uniref:SusD/RagB family nutrient-binding outer membrane lipoprotein n=1 Tax=Wocania ichthyoenteri TaxID=1230531 RepID=UPI000A7B754C|nr:SusD/RagB family nutrient-binding outer membrane lipoprotein [Wocania ichthyoenteri]